MTQVLDFVPIWTLILGMAVFFYVLLDGFDLGVGIIFAFARDENERGNMLAAISPVWDGNETWLIFTGTILFGAFPKIYATLLSAFYLPIILMLGALILRGVAFEFRYKATNTRWFWDWAFCGGSLIASFVQGVAVGALVRGLPMEDGEYVGGTFGWLSPFACLCGIGLCLGYALLGAGWLTAKCEGLLHDRARALLRPLAFGVFGFLAIAFVYALALDLRIMHRWLQRPYLLLFPAIGAVAALFLIRGISELDDNVPFRMTALIFLSAFGTLAISFWPYMIPFAITIDQAAAPPASLHFMFWGAGLFVLPLTLAYTGAVYRVFRGKIIEVSEEY
jgi:cytochrome bd ubiquinol oxidase subunit II